MIKKISQAIGFGLFCAILILFVAPYVNHQFTPPKSKIISYHDAVKVASPAVVNVYNQSFDIASEKNGLKVSNLGSGVIMTSSGYILTNRHVIQNADQIIVALQNGRIFSATLVGSDILTDLAVLKIQAKNLPFIPQNSQRPVRVGDVVLAIGNPFNLGQSITQGIISAIERNALSERGRQNFIQIDASINKGNSGGALINTAGELIGINTLSLGRSSEDIAEGLSFAIPITLANKVMAKIIQDGRVIRGYFGVGTELFYSAKQLGVGERGVVVTSVTKDGPAERGGVKPNDLILRIGNVEAESPRQMMEAIAEMRPDTQVEVLVLRQGKEKMLHVTIGEFPHLQ
ncbi:outer membrane-stress sensor serine endopeptidase DegS [Phocoenobacter skyensis]|uniref:Serine endoprotease DegS n=1 Tax=Phocoenobacter skyensis TaxID=97481 RepID=A0AAJ6NCU8_9PAST|nr:outer membrane-stress sensor serine endopeptidase DegS [Pasteurella skyensis]MDP8078758.1 outer membrane-stress sensor serine endopeptidase DegS [Pasteurella skyensis]MDP8084753.1 outer membrane-stress sensor serine endopeptidase DegS [Pasteurella skyensis]MDP8170177.1 outer membrane-stress sensor serine endopeptidase DegS [Pasteurella skyensis]MDP8174432.1 outer membrane-stress sensor serine endopeptidase DegS [Pasteurella skyensis]MDP8184101.1 outer membrane-stress sensor serine endopepti